MKMNRRRLFGLAAGVSLGSMVSPALAGRQAPTWDEVVKEKGRGRVSSLSAVDATTVTGGEIVKGAEPEIVPFGGYEVLPLEHQDGPELLDYTDEYLPRVREAGQYAWAATARYLGEYNNGGAVVLVGMGQVSVDATFSLYLSNPPRQGVGFTWHAEAGDPVGVVVFNYGLAGPFDVVMGMLEKLS